MASFADSISQFNPYIQQLPVEAMTQVGMYKQQKYDEGVQKIQSYIDNVAGMDVVRDIDKAYLQSKLNELGSKLKTVAAGDFSNYQLVNSVGGMSTQIAKDPNVQNAVSSSKMYRKGLEDMAAYHKEGKGSPSNDWDFNQYASGWLNSTNLDDRFNKRYDPYTNYKKNSLEVIKSLTKDSSITDDAFDYIDGKLVITDAITRRKLAGISPEKIQQALMAGLTPADWKQIEIDGRYSYANADGESFAKNITQSYGSKIKSFTDQRTVLENALSSTSSAEQKTLIKEKIGELDKTLANITRENASIIDKINSGNVEGAKAQLYTSDYISGFSRAFSFTEISDTYETSPLAQMAMEREKKNWDIKKFILDFEQKDRHFAINKDIEIAKITAAQEANNIAKAANLGYGGFPSPVDPKDVPDITTGKVLGQIQGLEDGIKTSDDKFIKAQGKDQAWLDQQRQAWMKSPNGVDPLVAQHFNNTEGARDAANENKTMLTLVSQEADRKYGNVYSAIPKDAPNLTYTTPSGNKITYTPIDFVDFNAKLNKYKTVTESSGPGGRGTVTFNDALAKAELSPKEYKLYEIEKARYYGGEKSLNRADVVLSQNLNNYYRTVNLPYGKKLTEKLDWTGNELKRRITGFQGVGYTVPTVTKAQEESLAGIFTDVANLAEKQKGVIANSPNLDVSILRKNAQSGNVKATINVVEGTEFSPAMYEVTSVGAGGTTTFRITPEQKKAIFDDKFEASPGVKASRPYLDMLRKFSKEGDSNWSTNPSGGPTNVSNAKLGPTHFPSIKGYGVSANIVSADAGSSMSIRLNIYDPVTKRTYEDIPYPRLLSQEELAKAMYGITDNWVYEIINGGKIATKQDLDRLQQASKNPL